ncbi:thioredoxin family protein [Stenomitos frigidus]|uniref:Thioredoxin n=1 Tax=Stenomitos frigidus ULC18 TaxID=2107698 RepID=A0A2T1EGU0_9CYAN|nr:thioredoxin family protein [Stenomitos frigidus]PSB31911.1 thiol reductase thioredoxin [Stenomitos frigidus ULC18]
MGEQTFVEEVLASPTPVVVHFGAPWCGPCKMIEPLLARFQAEWGKQFKLVGINADENLKLSSRYRITTLPTILLFEGGEVLHRLEGFHRRDDLWAELQRVLVNPSSSKIQPETISSERS